jgi:hypothetical protein
VNVSKEGRTLKQGTKELTQEPLKSNDKTINFKPMKDTGNSKKIECSPKRIENNNGVLKRFMKEFFTFAQFVKIGLFTKEMKDDYEAQSQKVCKFFGYKTVYEYGAKDFRCHLSFASKRPQDEPFVTEIKNIYE